MKSPLKNSPYLVATLVCYSVITPALSHAEPFRLSPILVNDYVEEDNDTESVVAKELWVGGKVATSIQDTPASVSVITQKEIEQRGAATTEEVLEYTPGTMTGYFSSDDRNDYYQIRGFDATTYRDGLTLGSLRGVREDAFAFERVEVIRGANSTLFGPADPGGSINFVTKRPKFTPFGNAFVSYGSYDHKEVGVDVGDTLDQDKTLAYRLTAKVKDSDREYDYSKDDSQFIMTGLTWEPTDATSATLIFDYLKTDSTPNSGGAPFDKEYDRSRFFGDPAFNDQDVERTNISAQISHDLGNGFKLRSNLRYSDLTNDYGYTYISDSIDRTGSIVNRGYLTSQSDAEQFNGNLMAQYDHSFSRLDSSTVVGIEYQDSTSSSFSSYGLADPIDLNNIVYSDGPSALTPYADQTTDYQAKAAFIQQNFALDDKYIVSFGARHDDIDLAQQNYFAGTDAKRSFSENTVRSAFTYKFNDEISAYISQVESVSPPSIGTELVRGEQTEIGAKYAPANMNALFSIAVYELEKSNVNIAVTQANGSIEREVVGKNEVKGIDLEARAELTDTLSISGGYSYIDSEVTQDDQYQGNDFTTTPQHSASLWGHYQQEALSLGLGARYVGSYYFDAANSKKSDDAITFDASVGYALTQATDLKLNVKNILDEQHVVGSGSADYYNPGRDIKLTLSHAW
ncbi:TonB-dependent siderophore receptor [Marinomonas ostreistagni]|uniref:TonB-dependent siderophore receptor n=1 Tax=Marinomonas ostreistagni TaxID=359209 RepID=UPI001952955A|nr:TonB-dependent siderophore receptor [Marinomonas ostreistagni]MBM6549807.1 TonB-dependent siderophore receptor [Marinomonas ostreistagni]